MFTLSFLAVALFILDASLVSARPKQRRSPTPVASIEGLTTNAKRFIAGLPPLPPVRRWIGSQVDSAKRQTPSSVPRAGHIEVISDGKILGWLSDDLDNGHFKLANAFEHANVFTANLFSGINYPVNFKDEDTSDAYLAGLISPGSTLDYSSGFAIVGRSSQVPLGPPQVNNPSIPGDPSETAIWTYDSATGSVLAIWMNESPAPPVALNIWYDNPAHTFYLTGSTNPPTDKSKLVTFRYDI